MLLFPSSCLAYFQGRNRKRLVSRIVTNVCMSALHSWRTVGRSDHRKPKKKETTENWWLPVSSLTPTPNSMQSSTSCYRLRSRHRPLADQVVGLLFVFLRADPLVVLRFPFLFPNDGDAFIRRNFVVFETLGNLRSDAY